MSSFKTPRKTNSSVSGSSATAVDIQVSESRKRQSKRDDAIRRKIENDLSKKKRSGTRTSRSKKAIPGTVLSLRPSEPIICKTSATVYEVSQLMSARRENCVLVVNDVGELLGIFTAKDLAFRIVGSGLNASTVTIDQIMTPNPQCANSNAPASEALTLMVERGFRHLPVLDDSNQIVGVLDITKCYAQQMEKLERMHASSKKLYEALDSVHSEMGVGQQPMQVFQYFENLKNKMNGPTLDSVLDANTTPVYSNVKSTVYEATVQMKENRTTAVLVKDSNDEVTGIFTSKDVVLRVIAAGLDPKKCSIVRVMTPQPDVAKVTLPIQQALRQMFEGHYLNLPVVGDQNDIIGIVEVLKLTYATLAQIKQLESADYTEQGTPMQQQDSEGPAWNKFWTSLDDDDTESVHSDSITGSAPDVTASEFQSFNVDIKPSDSISHVESPAKPYRQSALAAQPEENLPFTFKFTSPAIGGRVHRISLRPSEGISKLRTLIDAKLHPKDFEFLRVSKSEDEGEVYAISYVDDEGDIVSITSDSDLKECIAINMRLDNDKADLYVHNPHEQAPIENIKLINEKRGKNTIVDGISNELLISGALAVLASSIVLGFTLTRK
ncbi:CBS domain-containing protein [Scheffersomyces xylosifermentans]|uniref:CBS domain-containing protein n=1 Tax=Scheffersomyces xylosifermentans TaxID=1304137 RepID=UPI00315D04A6